jgi:hypothetical protein
MTLKTNGTPKTLDELIVNEMCIGTAATFRERMNQGLCDFLAQKFGVAMLKCHTPEQEALLEDLWLAITGERLKK